MTRRVASESAAVARLVAAIDLRPTWASAGGFVSQVSRELSSRSPGAWYPSREFQLASGQVRIAPETVAVQAT